MTVLYFRSEPYRKTLKAIDVVNEGVEDCEVRTRVGSTGVALLWSDRGIGRRESRSADGGEWASPRLLQCSEQEELQSTTAISVIMFDISNHFIG